MAYYLISDLHFGHKLMIEGGIRPFTYEDSLIENTVKSLQPTDILINLGDNVFGTNTNYKEFIWRCKDKIGHNGKMIMIRGNHDKRSIVSYLQDGWDWACDGFTQGWLGGNIGNVEGRTSAAQL